MLDRTLELPSNFEELWEAFWTEQQNCASDTIRNTPGFGSVIQGYLADLTQGVGAADLDQILGALRNLGMDYNGQSSIDKNFDDSPPTQLGFNLAIMLSAAILLADCYPEDHD